MFEIWVLINPIIKFLLYAASFSASGTILYYWHFKTIMSPETRLYCKQLIKKSSVSGVVVSIIFLFSIAGNLGGGVLSIFDTELLLTAIDIPPGKSAIFSFLGFTILYLSLSIRSFNHFFIKILSAGTILSSFIIVGHAAKSGPLSQMLIYIHLVCISYWVGSLLPLRNLCMSGSKHELFNTAEKFSKLAVLYISILLIAGISFSYILLDEISLLLTSTYGNLLLAKILFVGGLLAFGAFNKYWITPGILNDFHVSSKKLFSSINIEIILACSIFFLTSLLTTSVVVP